MADIDEYGDSPIPLSIIELLATRKPIWMYKALIKDYPKLEPLSETLRRPIREWK